MKDTHIFILLLVIGFVGGFLGKMYWESTQLHKPLIHEPINADDMVHIIIE